MPFDPDTLSALPANPEIEQALLGTLFVRQGKDIDRIAEILAPEHFHQPVHGRIFAAMLKASELGKPVTPPILRRMFDTDEALSKVGGGEYLAQLAINATGFDPFHYAKTIRDYWLRRELLHVLDDARADAMTDDLDRTAQDRVEALESRIAEVTGRLEGGKGVIHLSQAMSAAVARAESVYKANGKLLGVTTGLYDLDRALGGLQPTDLIIIAGRPAMGKTALATTIAENAARSGTAVGFFSLEMSGEQLAARHLAAATGISTERQRSNLVADDVVRLDQARERFERLCYFIDDTPAASVAQLKARARRLKRQNKLGLVIVDYLQLIVGGREENRVNEVSKITRDLKVMAKELEVPVLALSQLSRAVESREEKRPQLSDLRESGSIEQDADIVLFCFREEYYLTRSEPKKGMDDDDDLKFDRRWAKWAARLDEVKNTAEILIRKNRHGRDGTVMLRFDAEKTVFENLAR